MKSKIALKLASRNLIKMKDEQYLKLKYYYKTGKNLNLYHPKTFNEKLQWLKLFDRNSEYTKMVDKYEVKKYIASIIGNEYIIPTIGIYEKFSDIDFDKLPNQFVLKCTHDSGSIVICDNKELLDIKTAEKRLKNSLKKSYYNFSREWPYKNVQPRIMIESYMVDESKTELKDYKIFNFNGIPKLIQVDFNRFSGHKRKMYSTEWKPLEMNLVYPINENIKINKPKNLDKMLELAKILSKGIPFIRTDFYVINDKVYFGELTFYPEAGFGKFVPEEYDEILGDWIKLPNIKKEEK